MRALAVLALAATAAPAQDVSQRVPVGSVIEIRTRASIQDRLRGQVRAIDSVGVRFAVTRAGSTVDVPWDRVASIRSSPGRSHARGAFDGAWLGAVLGVANYVNGYPYNRTGPDAEDRKRRLAIASGSILVASTVVGLAIGSHRWMQAPLPPARGGTVALQFAPDDDVRVQSTLGDIIGTKAIASDSLRITMSTGPATFAWRNVGDLQVHGGKRRALGVAYGVAIALAVGTFGESFADFTNRERIAHLVVGGVVGYRFLSPQGWISLPQPN
jgi:hypothetical protein